MTNDEQWVKERAKDAIYKGWQDCKLTNHIGQLGRPCDCDIGSVVGCKARNDAIAAFGLEAIEHTRAEERAQTADALEHLGNLLSMLADLDEGDRSKAFDEALAFYNGNNPTAIVEPTGIATTYLVHKHPVLGICELTKQSLGIADLEAKLAEERAHATKALKLAHEMQDKAVAAEREKLDEAQRQYRIIDSHYRQQHDANLANLKRAEAAEAKLARLENPDEGAGRGGP